jgi:hypothetical protein
MTRFTAAMRPICAGAVAFLLMCATANAANYPLEITNIRDGLRPTSRLLRAYPGLEYNIRAAVIGGAFPYVYALEQAPAGMTINRNTGEIVWSNPIGSAKPTLIVTDSEGTRVSASWAINVSPAGFRFVDAAAGKPAAGNGCSSDCGAGTFDKPWRGLRDVHSSGQSGDIVYFKTGTYSVAGLPQSGAGGGWERVEFPEARRPVAWLAFPGATPVIDFAVPAGEVRPLIRFSGETVYVDGLETVNSRYIAFQLSGGFKNGATFRRLKMRANGPGVDGSNAAFIMTTSGSQMTHTVIQDCEFSDVTGVSVTIKIYSQEKLLIEDTVHTRTPTAIELKADVRQFTVRGNRFSDVARTGIGGNMHNETTFGEILFNNVRAGVPLDLNQDGMAKKIDVYRNTFVGRVQVRNTDASDGPFLLANNVIISPDSGVRGSRVYFERVSDPTRITVRDNLTGSPSEKIIDALGNLLPSYAASIGKIGHQIAPDPAKR